MKRLKGAGVVASPGYRRLIADLKARVNEAHLSAARAVNKELVLLYWDIGRGIVESQRVQGWGESVVEFISADLRRAFPGVRGFAPRSVWNMRRLYLAYSAPEILPRVVAEMRRGQRGPILPQAVAEMRSGRRGSILPQIVAEMPPGRRGPILPQAVAELKGRVASRSRRGAAPPGGDKNDANADMERLREAIGAIPWGHHLAVLEKVEGLTARLYYLRAAAELGWTRNVLLNQIKAGAYERTGERKMHNFDRTLPEHLAEQADEMLKSSYGLDFLGLRREVKERELEERLIGRLRDFILELGYGFCFVGRQHRLVLGKKEYFVDLLFYHRFLRALVAFELKMEEFEPEFAGKMDFYLNVLNDTQRGPGDNPSIGVILCREKDDLEVEYALRAKSNPIGVAAYQLRSKLPKELKGKLPTAKQLAGVMKAEIEDPP